MRNVGFKVVFFVIWLCAFAVLPLCAWDFGVVPRLDKTVTLFLGHEWQYGEMLYSSAEAEFETLKESDEGQDEHMTTALSTFSKQWLLSSELLGIRTRYKKSSYGVALGLQYIDLLSDESQSYVADAGYEILPGSAELVVSNHRSLQVVLPRASTRFDWSNGPISFRIGGEYAPLIFVRLSQTLDTEPAYPGATDDGAISSGGDYQAHHSFSLNGRLQYLNRFISPELSVEYDRIPINYDLATLSGVQRLETTIQDLKVRLLVEVSRISVFGYKPTIAVRFDRAWTTIVGQENVEHENEFAVRLGVRN